MSDNEPICEEDKKALETAFNNHEDIMNRMLIVLQDAAYMQGFRRGYQKGYAECERDNDGR